MERQLGELEERQKRLAAMCESALVEAASGHLPADGGASELRLAAGEALGPIHCDGAEPIVHGMSAI